ncbi:adenosine deaminase [Marinicella sp. S1101]|uniref:adenosine deaminase n=1 Tax=Marinicella marina TaxID=2996016 RepID=UPI002260D457|nr:adenosine deaminase [Marinicella marina]MCX7553020.1 adenosine deaminase [Marinicella marina]MDJ1139670.1 adenosine deaminase [Marinicella marina]
MNELIQLLPKAELHMHIEGSLEPELMFKLAERNGIELPYDSVDELKAKYNFNNLQEFLDIYYQGCAVLQTEQDFYDLAWAYLEKAKDDHVVHTEIFYDPQSHTNRGIPFETAINGLYRAFDDAQNQLGISFHIIACFLRHLPEQDALDLYPKIFENRDKILGIGLDSSEMGHPPEKYQKVFAQAKKDGFKVVAHAGEEGPAAYVREAIDILQVDRIDHGNRCLDDDILTAQIAKAGLALTVCPLSNLKLQVVKDLKDHPIKTMLNKGLMATINSDDPAYFGGYINDNFYQLAEAVSLSDDQIFTLVENSFKASFLPESIKEIHLKALNSFGSHE